MLTKYHGKKLWEEKSEPNYKIDLKGQNGKIYSKVYIYNDDFMGSQVVVKNLQHGFWDIHIIPLNYELANFFDYLHRLGEDTYMIFDRLAEIAVNKPTEYYEPVRRNPKGNLVAHF